MEEKKFGDLDVDLSALQENPQCPHGPTLLFRRRNKDGSVSTKDAYYACSAYRDSKECRFHLAFGAKREAVKMKQQQSGGSKKRKRDEMLEFHRPERWLDDAEVAYCARCSHILAEEEVSGHNHKEVQSVDPRFPTRFLLPLNENQSEAQYFFSKSTLDFFLGLVQSQKVKRIINIGCPRLHEEAISSSVIKAKSFLLDLDSRFAQFFPRKSFAQYNMFNNHFLTELGHADFKSFLGETAPEDVLIVMDPPFGGRVEVLGHNLRQLFVEIGGECRVAWIFPYFMEKHVIRELPSLVMDDYKVEYDNHRKFKQVATGAGRGSPVRIFTNIQPAASIPHPSKEGYWMCADCERYSSRENKHCLACGVCSSKDGKTWRHCQTCAKCVKPDWNHCKKCKRCHAKTCLAKAETTEDGASFKKRSWKFSGGKR
ncbi:Zinc finger CCHC domain-containing protein 4 [Hypsibius exemplaris]|uniref:Zinc finger CCHC domain-containing protein 4 n=1 Tax=Hypsibius exemplaris TaxID=2072580 RepID=A0A1W0W964_HYPEX|nr:Zinc finger CCHC domain-containing protein 4 [Hypsibius exemplaris]